MGATWLEEPLPMDIYENLSKELGNTMGNKNFEEFRLEISSKWSNKRTEVQAELKNKCKS